MLLLLSCFVDSAIYCTNYLQKSNDGEWTKLLLLLAGDIERNPGPTIGEFFPIFTAAWCLKNVMYYSCYRSKATPTRADQPSRKDANNQHTC